MDSVNLSFFYPLIERAVDNRLTAEEHAQLEQALRDSPRLRERYLEAVGLHIQLDQLSQQDEICSPTAKIRPDRHLPSRILGGTAAGLSLLLLLFVTIRITYYSSSPPVTTALQNSGATVSPLPILPMVIEVANPRLFGEGLIPSPGQALQWNHEYHLSQGYLAIQFERGARTVLQAPCVFRILGSETLELHSGQCSVHAPSGAEGFQVLSPSAEVIDLGTRFAVEVGEMGETEVSVIEGKASLRSADDVRQQPLMLSQGDSARVDPGQQPRKLNEASGKLAYLENLPDRVIRYSTTMSPEGLADELLTIDVQRGGKILQYSRDQLVRSRLQHFEITADKAAFCTRMNEELPTGQARLGLLDEDWSLVTGIINPLLTESRTPESENRPVMVVEFAEPVVNGPGPDIVLFDLQVLVSNPSGDTVILRSGDPRPTRPIYTQNQFDIDLTSPFALDLMSHKTYRCAVATHSLQELVDHDFHHGHQVHINAKAIALGIDLTDLGYQPGEALTQLEFLPVFDRNVFDPVLIIGLPDVPR